MSIFQILFDLIAMRSFSNLWYWIALAVTWSTASHWVLGVPFDMVLRARRRGGEAEEDLIALTHASIRRLLRIGREAGLVLAVIVPAILSFLAVSGFVFGSELGQAVFLLVFPLSLVWLVSLRVAARLEAAFLAGISAAQIDHALSRHRIAVQSIGLVAITVTALWGMYQNLRYSFF